MSAVGDPAARQRSELARAAEERVARWLENHRWRILDQNWFCRGGELDLVARRDDVIAFVEVRARRSGQRPELSVSRRKMDLVCRAARHWCTRRQPTNVVLRFDLAGVIWPHHGEPRLSYIPNAFRPKRPWY